MFKLEKFYPEGFDYQRYWEDKYAREHIAGQSSEEFRKQGFWPILEKNIDKNGRYLDVGCGIGGWILFLTEEGYDVEGIDIAARTIRALTEYNPDLKLKIAGMPEIPYEGNSMDGILAIGTLEYVEDKVLESLSEVHRVLKDNGMFFIEVPIANTIRKLVYIPLKRLEKIIRAVQGKQPTFSNYLFDVRELQDMLEQQGFEVVEVQAHELPGDDCHYGLYIDWPIFRGSEPYRLNVLGRIVKTTLNAISPWIASTGAVIVAKKRKA